jgi:hypothetical protein
VRRSLMRLLVISTALLLATACREQLGPPDYSSHLGLDLPGDAGTDDAGPLFRPGTSPFIPGIPRLNIGIFLETPVTNRFNLSAERQCLRALQSPPGTFGPLRCYLIFEAPAGGRLSYEQTTTDDRIEGQLSDVFTLTGTPFWGGGVLWDEATDLSSWDVMAVALKSSDADFATLEIGMQAEVREEDEEGNVTTRVVAASVNPAAYGYAADGEWHPIRIPLADFQVAGEPIDLANIRAPLTLAGTGNTRGARLQIDEVYLFRD